MTRPIITSLLLAFALGATIVIGAQGARGTSVTCGTTIISDTKLDNDLRDCPDNGIVIAADDITLDLNGHVIDGDDTEFSACGSDDVCDIGIVAFDHHGLTVKGGRVTGFTFGALVVGVSDSRLTRLELTDHLFSGLLVADSSGIRGDRITASRNGLTTDQAGIDVFESRDLAFSENTVDANGDIGYFLSGMDDSRIERSSLSGNLEAGILLDHGNRNVFRRNRIVAGEVGIVVSGDGNTVSGNELAGVVCEGQCGYGVSLEGGTGNVIEENTAVRFHDAGIHVAAFEEFGGPPTHGNTVRGNTVGEEDLDGVLVESSATNTVLERNRATGAGDDGFDVRNSATSLTQNVATRNGDFGIEAVSGVSDGGGNRASGNGNPAQCVNVACK